VASNIDVARSGLKHRRLLKDVSSVGSTIHARAGKMEIGFEAPASQKKRTTYVLAVKNKHISVPTYSQGQAHPANGVRKCDNTKKKTHKKTARQNKKQQNKKRTHSGLHV
jgi:hypothetical protein